MKYLGNNNAQIVDPTKAQLDLILVVDPKGVRYTEYAEAKNCCARFTCPEFTSLCPATGQPDFATIVISYIPDQYFVESKSLKLFLHSFRNHGAYHETCTLLIAETIITQAEPEWFRIEAYWYPRGGIPIDVFYQTGDPPPGVLIPPIENRLYQGR